MKAIFHKGCRIIWMESSDNPAARRVIRLDSGKT